MDELVYPTSSSSSPFPASFFSAAGHQQVLEFVSSEVLEQWLGSDDWPDEPQNLASLADEGSHSAGNDMSGELPAPAANSRGRKPRPQTNAPAITHVEAERQRRNMINRRFCELRAAVPMVSRMDKASLLADAAAYITEQRGRVERLEAEVTQAAARKTTVPSAAVPAATHSFGLGEKLEVRMVGREAAALRLTTAARHAPARMMDALRWLDLPVQHASVCVVGGLTVLDVVVDVPAAALRDEGCLRAALLHML